MSVFSLICLVTGEVFIEIFKIAKGKCSDIFKIARWHACVIVKNYIYRIYLWFIELKNLQINMVICVMV